MKAKHFLVYYVLILLAVTVWAAARADTWASPEQSLAWDHPTPDVVQGYRIFCEAVKAGDTANQTITLAELTITEGRHECYVIAYNPSGESGASNTVPFVFTTSAPDTPTGVVISP